MNKKELIKICPNCKKKMTIVPLDFNTTEPMKIHGYPVYWCGYCEEAFIEAKLDLSKWRDTYGSSENE